MSAGLVGGPTHGAAQPSCGVRYGSHTVQQFLLYDVYTCVPKDGLSPVKKLFSSRNVLQRKRDFKPTSTCTSDCIDTGPGGRRQRRCMSGRDGAKGEGATYDKNGRVVIDDGMVPWNALLVSDKELIRSTHTQIATSKTQC